MDKSCIQLEMNFNGSAGNRFKDRLDTGEFQVLTEFNIPSGTSNAEQAASRSEELEYLVMSQKGVSTAIAFTDFNPKKEETPDLISFASALCKTGRDSHLIYSTGRDRTRKQIISMLAHAHGEGFKNICAVSGATCNGEDSLGCTKHLFTESVNILKFAKEDLDGKILTGCVVNPFKYNPADDFTQYFKLVKKINTGASFVVTQFGWDMLKLQELRWNLYRRGLHIPSLARFLFLTPDRVEDISSGKYPGVHISPDFQVALRRETMYSSAQFEVAQLRRLQIHAAGAKFLGYSGIQLAGIERKDLLATALAKIAEALKEFQSFEEWRAVYQEYYARMDMAPYPHRFYMFEDLFSSAHPPEELRMREAKIPNCTGGERMLYKIGKILFSHASELPASERRLTKKLLFSCRSCSACRLPKTSYLCPEICPKGMANGPCGGSKANGDCELEENECIFSRRMRIANEFHDYLSLEETYVPSLEKRPDSFL